MAEADDALQEAWLRLSRADSDEVRNLGGWLTTVVARICLNMLQSRRTRREEPLDSLPAEPAAEPTGLVAPEQQAVLADSVGLALLVVLDTLTPAERLAFVLHDISSVSASTPPAWTALKTAWIGCIASGRTTGGFLIRGCTELSYSCAYSVPSS